MKEYRKEEEIDSQTRSGAGGGVSPDCCCFFPQTEVLASIGNHPLDKPCAAVYNSIRK